jgi:hypothetical protein
MVSKDNSPFLRRAGNHRWFRESAAIPFRAVQGFVVKQTDAAPRQKNYVSPTRFGSGIFFRERKPTETAVKIVKPCRIGNP